MPDVSDEQLERFGRDLDDFTRQAAHARDAALDELDVTTVAAAGIAAARAQLAAARARIPDEPVRRPATTGRRR